MMLECLYILMKSPLTLKHRETHGCIVSTVATDAHFYNNAGSWDKWFDNLISYEQISYHLAC